MIDVLLATYNGEKYLPELLESLESQTYRDWRLIIRDDGSTDGTPLLIGEWAKKYPEKVCILRNGRTRLGPCASFGALLEASQAPYFMFCDQDDVWLPRKVELLLQSVQTGESCHGSSAPILAHSDLVVVDETLNTLASSFWQQQGITPALSRAGLSNPRHRLRVVLKNPVTGCALMGNAALRKAATPIPKQAIMHDWWVALVAVFTGQLVAIDAATVLYRQHGNNTLGAKSRHPIAAMGRALRSPRRAIERTRQIIASTKIQSGAFAELLSQSLDDHSLRRLLEYSNLSEASFIGRKLFLVKNGLFPKNLMHGIVLTLCI